ncbi:MAG: hypothetical protein KUG65_04575 [Sphingomonadaceae bacterium]|nr:hypothetical protein [Sphingomonadaceae bacterium]
MDYVRLGNTVPGDSPLCSGGMSFGDSSKSWHKWILDTEKIDQVEAPHEPHPVLGFS